VQTELHVKQTLCSYQPVHDGDCKTSSLLSGVATI